MFAHDQYRMITTTLNTVYFIMLQCAQCFRVVSGCCGMLWQTVWGVLSISQNCASVSPRGERVLFFVAMLRHVAKVSHNVWHCFAQWRNAFFVCGIVSPIGESATQFVAGFRHVAMRCHNVWHVYNNSLPRILYVK